MRRTYFTAILFIISALFILPASVSAFEEEKPLIDPVLKEVDEEIDRLEEENCSKIKNVIKNINCERKIWIQFEKEGKFRGTKQYCWKNYSDLSFSQLEQLRKKLLKEQKTARPYMDLIDYEDRQPGEVTKESLQVEIFWIEDKLEKIHRKKMDEIERKLNIKTIR